ncbi:MAG: class II aldolase/adducin family protein [Planctomycetota bacterium]|jgi:rhamnose utilization protein RhaD (predicted bifunctional aldolase and dehydrogenase)
MNKALAELIRISNETGGDLTLVQGGGGNTSVKTADGKYMYIKASGTALKDMNQKKGWRRIRLEPVLAILKDKSLPKLDESTREPKVVNMLLDACDDNVKTIARPSVEAHLHACLNTCVIHLHPSAAGAYVNAKNGKAKLVRLFKDETFPPLWVPYTDPGFLLAKKIARLVNNYQDKFGKKPSILFLEKHGLFITSKTATGALRLVRSVMKRCNSKLKHPRSKSAKAVQQEKISALKLCIERAYFQAIRKRTKIWYYYNDAIADFLNQKDAKKMLSGSLTPDELVYANGPAMWIELPKSKKSFSKATLQNKSKIIAGRIKQQKQKGKKPYVAFLVKNIGLFVAGTEKIAPTVRDIVLYSIFIRTNAYRMGGILTLNRRQEDFINNWESEAFRMKLASGNK